jgi:alpha-L-rhamnosidase
MRYPDADDPFIPVYDRQDFWHRPMWPARWIFAAGAPAPPVVVALRLTVRTERPQTVRARVSADECYELRLDGRLVGRGPERGAPDHWYFATHDLPLTGTHCLVAKVWALGPHAPVAQMSVQPGFLLAAEDPAWSDALNTGVATWEAHTLPGYAWIEQPHFPFDGWTGRRQCLDAAALDPALEAGRGDDWAPAVEAGAAWVEHPTDLAPLRLLRPAPLPPLLRQPAPPLCLRYLDTPGSLSPGAAPVDRAAHRADEAPAWQALLAGTGAVTVPAHSRRRAIAEFAAYVCAYPELHCSGGRGARVRIALAETLFAGDRPGPLPDKGDRRELVGRRFLGSGDEYLPAGRAGAALRPLWWLAGRYVEIAVETRDEPLEIAALTFEETRRPLEPQSAFGCDDPRWARLEPLLVRTLQVHCHDTFMDSPHFEQISYTADSRLESLCLYAMTRDAALPRKMIELFGSDPLPRGFLPSRFPSRKRQSIPPFSLLWTFMVREHVWWRGDRAWLREWWPTARRVLDGYLALRDGHGCVLGPPGWNFIDWIDAPGWHAGVPPGGGAGPSAPVQWLLATACVCAVEVETWLGETELAARWSRLADELAAAAEVFWDEARGLYATTPGGADPCEHTQAFALLADRLPAARRARLRQALLAPPAYPRATLFFTDFVVEALRAHGAGDAVWERLAPWFAFPDRGLITTPEVPDPSRSDCHGWSAHPWFHAFATVLGVRPGAPEFAAVDVRPALGPLREARGRLVHPRGEITVELRRIDDDALHATVALPPGVPGVLTVYGTSVPLAPGARLTRTLRSASAPA